MGVSFLQALPRNGLNAVHTRCPDCLRQVPAGRFRHAQGERLPRHLHREAFVTVVLGGGYEEAGDSGLHRVVAGDVVWHAGWERHLDRFDGDTTDVLVLPLATAWRHGVHGRIADPDALARLHEHDPRAALQALDRHWQPATTAALDWPAQLAQDLLRDPALRLDDWSAGHGLHRGSVSRGFGQVFGLSPQAFRLQARGHHALHGLREGGASLGALAHACGFADQPHLNRTLLAMTGMTPGQLATELSALP